MYNYVFLVGRLVRDVEVHNTEGGHSVSTISLAVQRPFKNPQTNLYDVDFINIVLWEPLCNNVAEYSHKGDTLGIKGRIQCRKEERDGQTLYLQEIIAERVIFINSNNKIED